MVGDVFIRFKTYLMMGQEMGEDGLWCVVLGG